MYRCKRCRHSGESHDLTYWFCDECYNDCGYEPWIPDGFFDINGRATIRVDH